MLHYKKTTRFLVGITAIIGVTAMGMFLANESAMRAQLSNNMLIVDDSETQLFRVTTGTVGAKQDINAYLGNQSVATAGARASVSWNFGVVPTGGYDVFVTWARATTNETAVVYNLMSRNSDNSTSPLLAGVTVDQTQDPKADHIENGIPFQKLGTVNFVGKSLYISLKQAPAAGKTISFDAVLLKPSSISQPPSVPQFIDLSIALTPPERIIRGVPASFDFAIENIGTKTVENIILRDPLRGGFTLLNSEGATCTQINSVVTCDPFSLQPQVKRIIRLVFVTAPPSASCSPKLVDHTGELIGVTGDIDPNNNVVPILQSMLLCDAGTTEITKSIPDNSVEVCREAVVREDIGRCLNNMLYNHVFNLPLTIKFSNSDTYFLKNTTIDFFQRRNVTLDGNNATIKVSPDHDNSGDVLKNYMMNIIGGSNITIKNFTFDGSGTLGIRGIGICGASGFPVDSITIDNNKAINIADTFVLVGNAYLNYLRNLVRLSWISPENRVCTGSISNIAFTNNQVEIGTPESSTGFGFYVAPYSGLFASGTQVNLQNWIDVANIAPSRTSNIVIEGNTFTAKSDNVNSGIKIQQVENVKIHRNTFDALAFKNAFRRGAAINISANTRSTTVSENTIRFPQNTTDKERAIVIEGGFRKHSWYGVGANGITTPALNVSVHDNNYENSRARIFDCCDPAIGDFCLNNENRQRTVSVEQLVFSNNRTNLLKDPLAITSALDAGKPWTQACRMLNLADYNL